MAILKYKPGTVPRLLENQLDEQAQRAAKLGAASRRSALRSARLVESAHQKIADAEQALAMSERAQERARRLLKPR